MVADVNNMLLTFDTCNVNYFEGKLLFPQFGLLHSFRTCGYFNCRKGRWLDNSIYDPCISITDYYDFTKSQFVDIMCHEMIHYYLAYFGFDRRLRHGKEFTKMAEKLNRTYGLNINSTLDISKYKRRDRTPLLSYWLAKLI